MTPCRCSPLGTVQGRIRQVGDRRRGENRAPVMHARTRFLALFLATLLLAASAFRADAAPAPGARAADPRAVEPRRSRVRRRCAGGDRRPCGCRGADRRRQRPERHQRLPPPRPTAGCSASSPGCASGSNTLTARAGGRAARLTVKNAPIGGPVFSGPQIQPWTCQAGAVDAKCNQATTYQLLYLPTAGAQLQAVRPGEPAAGRLDRPRPRRRPGRRFRSSCGRRPATSPATSTASPCCSSPASRGRRRRRSRSSTTSS